eukprot:456467_1
MAIFKISIFLSAAAAAFAFSPQSFSSYSYQRTVAFPQTNTRLHQQAQEQQEQESSHSHPESSSSQSSILTDMDLMCIANAADLCTRIDIDLNLSSDDCDLEEREALLNRFEEQEDILAERLAMMQVLTHHLKNGNVSESTHHLKNNGDDGKGQTVDENEMRDMKRDILHLVQNRHFTNTDTNTDINTNAGTST